MYITCRQKHMIIHAVMLLAVAWMGGCAKLTVFHYPDFWQPGEIETVIVKPFDDSAVQNRRAGDMIASRFASALALNGTYQHVFFEAPPPAEGAADQGEKTARSVVIDGYVIQFIANSYDYLQYLDNYPWYGDASPYRYGHRYYRSRRYGYPNYGYYYYTRTEASVAVTATMKSADSGEIIHATPGPLHAYIVCEQQGLARNTRQCLDLAIDNVVLQLVDEFAVTQVTISVNAGKALRIVSGLNEKGEWQKRDTFTTADTTMTVVIALPDVADRNTFDITITRKGSETPLAAKTVTWDRNAPRTGMTLTFNLSEISSAGGGPGEYEVRFYSNGKQAFSRKFKIEEAE